jgi:hypothetical protein
MNVSEKTKIYYNVWCCAHQRRHNAKLKKDWELYDREHETVLMCLNMKDVKFYQFDTEKPRYLE